ncbi:hypothetical protein ACN077_24825 [Clostridium chromiireducens]|uniref:hypothetical protein n=1 Tax=Clostridium chromiireducens TaxID=225345 RepID=UPI003AF51986
MKKLNLSRIIVSTLIISLVFILNTLGANAEWRQDSNGWWNSEGNSWSIGWRYINGEWYYFEENGYMAHDTIIDGYKLDSDGAWIESTQNKLSNSEQDVREIAFNQLDSQVKKSIKGTWQNAKLSKITLADGMGNITDKSYIGKEVYIIKFPTEMQSTANEIIVYIGMDNYKLIGYGLLD